MNKPFSAACERNQVDILAELKIWFADRKRVLEIASGTGQHAVYFARQLPHVTWQTSDLPSMHAGILAWMAEAHLPNVLAPIALDVNVQPWGVADVDAVFNANTVHIVSWDAALHMLRGIAAMLNTGGVFCLYGPFNYAGAYTSESNATFDSWLKTRDAHSGIRDFEAIARTLVELGFELLRDTPMPANNHLLVWRKISLASSLGGS